MPLKLAEKKIKDDFVLIGEGQNQVKLIIKAEIPHEILLEISGIKENEKIDDDIAFKFLKRILSAWNDAKLVDNALERIDYPAKIQIFNFVFGMYNKYVENIKKKLTSKKYSMLSSSLKAQSVLKQ